MSVDSFVSAANTAGSIFYTNRSTYGSTSSVYYASDCASFVSWCWGVDRKTTYSIPFVSTYIGMATASNAYLLQLGDCLNSNDVGHVVLVTDLVYSGSTLTSIEITEQTPPQLKRSYYTPSELGAKYGTYYGIYRYSGTVPAAPDGSTNSGSSTPSGSTSYTDRYYPACDSSQTSLIPAMSSIGVSMDWTLQCRIAETNGITDFSGTAEQNTELLNLLKAGKLLNPDYKEVSYYAACDSSCTTFYTGMSNIGIECDWTLHCQIAEANGITDFSGTAEQNETLLALLKSGKLIVPGGSGSSGDSSDDSSDDSSGNSSSTPNGTTGYDRGYKGGMAGSGQYTAFGLDVSSWQGSDLNFQRIKNAGYDYVILRAGTTKGKDTLFDSYYNSAKAAGLDVGAYYYSYALNTSTAASDAENMISYLKGKTFEYPIYFDYEDSTQQSLNASNPSLSASICLTFMDRLAEEGYLVGMYTGQYFSTQLPLSTICSKYEIWIAHYLAVGDGSYNGTYDYTTYGPSYASKYGMYQFTDSVWINGYGPYDGDVCYKDYPTIVKTYGFNGYSAPESGGDQGGTEGDQSKDYIDKCTFYPSSVKITVTEATSLFSEPRNAKDDNTSVVLEAAPLDTTYTTIGLYANTGGNMWYQVKTSDGQIGYIYSGRVKYEKKAYSDIKLTGYDVPNGHVEGNIFSVTGTIKATYNTLKNANVYIYAGFGTSSELVTGGSAAISNNKYVLDGSTVDDAVAFDALPAGNYTYVISADYESYYADTKQSAKKLSGTRTLKKVYFVVVDSAVNQSSCKHTFNETVLVAPTYEATGSSISACSTCGLIQENTLPKLENEVKPVEKFDITLANLTLGNDLTLYFYVPVDACAEWPGAYAVITKPYADGTPAITSTVALEGLQTVTNGGQKLYKVPFTGIAAKEMADVVSIQVFNADDEAISNVGTESVRSYVHRFMDKNAADSTKMRLAVDMLNYGAAAQVNFEYNTGDLANANLTAAQKAFGTANNAVCVNGNVKDANTKGSNLTLESSILMNFHFYNLKADMYAEVSFTNHEGKQIKERLGAHNGSMFVVNQVVVADARQLVTVTVYNADGSVYATCTDSVESYVARARVANASGLALYEAIIKFADSAYEYLH